MILALAFLLGVVPGDAAAANVQPGEPADCEAPCEWSTHGRPEGLLQASRCVGGAPGEALAPPPSGALLRLSDLPACLQPAFAALAAAVAADASEPPQKAVLRARIARQYYEASAYYQPTGRQIVLMPPEIDRAMDVLQNEWPAYASPDGDLGWSGFLLVLEGDEPRVRIMEDDPRPGDFWHHSEAILSEFFPGATVQPLPR